MGKVIIKINVSSIKSVSPLRVGLVTLIYIRQLVFFVAVRPKC